MVMKVVAGNCLHWQQQQPAIPNAQSFLIFSGGIRHSDRSLLPCRSRLSRRQSLNLHSFVVVIGERKRTNPSLLPRASTYSSFDGLINDDESDEDFVKRIQDLVLKVNHTDADIVNSIQQQEEQEDGEVEKKKTVSASVSENFQLFSVEPPWPAVRPETPEWADMDEIVPASVERKANSVDIPLSLRIIKKKKKRLWEENLFTDVVVGESARCSVKKAFSSMVFILRELQSYTLQMREALLYENLQGILARVQGEMTSSFVWLFQQIFSCTPTLMVYVMLLLANFTVHSVAQNSAALAAMAPNPPVQQSDVVVMEQHDYRQANNPRFDQSSVKTFSVGRTASVGGNGGGGGKVKPVAGGMDDGSYSNGSKVVLPEEEAAVWNRLVEEATKMQASTRDGAVMDHKTLQSFVSPVRVETEPEDYEAYSRTEMMYHQALALDPDNTLLLSNFAQFLYLVLHDHDRAEYYFKRAVGIKPADAESLNRYASFLWLVQKDLDAAEEAYLEAIAAEPDNTYYAANYAHFLWNTGSEDTCYPINGSHVS